MYSIIEHPSIPIRFLITDCPSNDSLSEYISLFEENRVGCLIRLCESTAYDPSPVAETGIVVRDDMAFADGEFWIVDHEWALLLAG
jgi:protein tyrosine phosphatase type 4A